MSSPHLPAELLSDIAIALIWAGGAALTALASYFWVKLEKRVDAKVDLSEHEHLNEKLQALGDKFDCFSGKMEKKMEERGEIAHKVEIQLSELRSQVGRLVSHIDSETRNRATQDMRIEQTFIGELRALRHSIISYGRRKGDPPETLP